MPNNGGGEHLSDDQMADLLRGVDIGAPQEPLLRMLTLSRLVPTDEGGWQVAVNPGIYLGIMRAGDQEFYAIEHRDMPVEKES